MAISEVGQQNYGFPIFKSRLRFVIQDTVRAQIVNTENDRIIREVPPSNTNKLRINLYV